MNSDRCLNPAIESLMIVYLKYPTLSPSLYLLGSTEGNPFPHLVKWGEPPGCVINYIETATGTGSSSSPQKAKSILAQKRLN